MHCDLVYCVTWYDESDEEIRTLKISRRDEAIAVGEVIHGLLSYGNDKVKVIEGEPKVIWESSE